MVRNAGFIFIFQEQVETPESNSTHSAHAQQSDRVSNATTGPSGGEQTEDEAEDEGTVELPPPMEEIQTLPIPSNVATSTPPGGMMVEEDVHSKLVSS